MSSSAAAAKRSPAVTDRHLNAMSDFWAKELKTVKDVDFKKLKAYDLPLARIKKIMKADEDVKMISADAPVLLAKACELFVLDITARAYLCASDENRQTVTKADVSRAIRDGEMFDFLHDMLTSDEDGGGGNDPSVTGVSSSAAYTLQSRAEASSSSSSSPAGRTSNKRKADDIDANELGDGDDDDEQASKSTKMES